MATRVNYGEGILHVLRVVDHAEYDPQRQEVNAMPVKTAARTMPDTYFELV